MKVIVTGGAGFIGSNIVKELVAHSHQVKVIDNLSTGQTKNLDSVIDKIDFINGDIQDLDLLQREFKNFDYVLHQAALPSVPRSIADPMDTHHNNITGALNVLIAARDNKMKRVVLASSSSIYGDIEGEYKIETMAATPLSPYALSKHTVEIYSKLFYKLYGLETVCLRYFNVFGPHQSPDSEYAAVIPKFIRAIVDGKSPIVYGDGTQSRDFTYVTNVVEANMLAMTSLVGAGETFNVACNENITINQLVQYINEATNNGIKPVYQSERAGDIKHSKADINKIRNLLNYHPQITFKDGLDRTIRWYLEQHRPKTHLTS